MERVLVFGERSLRLCEKLEADRRFGRVVSQLVGAGTSPGAQVHEADAAMSTPDFIKCLAIATKELNECRYWLKLIGRMGWIKPELLQELDGEAFQLLNVLHAIIIRSRKQK